LLSLSLSCSSCPKERQSRIVTHPTRATYVINNGQVSIHARGLSLLATRH
jgi:hypothetical protein